MFIGRSRELQGLARAMVKLWERSAIAKVAIKRGVLNTRNERMAEELKVRLQKYCSLLNVQHFKISLGLHHLAKRNIRVVSIKHHEADLHCFKLIFPLQCEINHLDIFSSQITTKCKSKAS